MTAVGRNDKLIFYVINKTYMENSLMLQLEKDLPPCDCFG
jgi:hypothetical protein